MKICMDYREQRLGRRLGSLAIGAKLFDGGHGSSLQGQDACAAPAPARRPLGFPSPQQGVKLCPSTSTATAGEVAVSTTMPAPGVSDNHSARASFARRASRLLPSLQIGLRGDNANQCTVSPACS